MQWNSATHRLFGCVRDLLFGCVRDLWLEIYPFPFLARSRCPWSSEGTWQKSLWRCQCPSHDAGSYKNLQKHLQTLTLQVELPRCSEHALWFALRHLSELFSLPRSRDRDTVGGSTRWNWWRKLPCFWRGQNSLRPGCWRKLSECAKMCKQGSRSDFSRWKSCRKKELRGIRMSSSFW